MGIMRDKLLNKQNTECAGLKNLGNWLLLNTAEQYKSALCI